MSKEMALQAMKWEKNWKIVLWVDISLNGLSKGFIEMFWLFYKQLLLYYCSPHKKGVSVFPALTGPLNWR